MILRHIHIGVRVAEVALTIGLGLAITGLFACMVAVVGVRGIGGRL